MAKGALLSQDVDLSTLATKDEMKKYVSEQIGNINSSPWIEIGTYHIPATSQHFIQTTNWPNSNVCAFQFKIKNYELKSGKGAVYIGPNNGNKVFNLFSATYDSGTATKNTEFLSMYPVVYVGNMYKNRVNYRMILNNISLTITTNDRIGVLQETNFVEFDLTVSYMK